LHVNVDAVDCLVCLKRTLKYKSCVNQIQNVVFVMIYNIDIFIADLVYFVS